jgi:catechol O-methyltransferase
MPFILTLACGLAGLLVLHTLLGKPIPFLRWSFLQIGLANKRLMKDWQVGDDREELAAQYVLTHSKPGDLEGAIRAIDEFAYQKKFLINVGDEKGEILDQALKRVQPKRALELGAYIGYSALRTARHLPPGGHLYSIEFSQANAEIARRVIAHAGVSARVTFIHGYLGDGGKTLERLEKEFGFSPGCLDFVFIDHSKDAYLPDLKTLLEKRWLHTGSVIVADNVKFPGAPEYHAYMQSEEGKTWETRVHKTHVEYQSVIKDWVLESTLRVAQN